MGIKTPIVFPMFGHQGGIVSYEFFDKNSHSDFFESISCCGYLCKGCLDKKKDIREKIYHDQNLLKCYSKCPICQKRLEKNPIQHYRCY